MAINTKGTGAQRKAGPDDDCDGDAADGVQSPRDVATGQASGRRQHCMAIKSKGTGAQRTKADPDEDCDGVDAADGVQSPRDLATGQASGRREAATGQASGKRQHCLAIKTKGTSAK
jgi:hypothetical protein